MHCKDLERLYGERSCKCVHYRKEFPDCACEQASVSEHSPGIVRHDEILIRTLYSPHQIDQNTGAPRPAAFSDVLNRGLSVDRKNHISQSDLEDKIQTKIAHDKAQGKDRGNFSVVTATCESVRKIMSEKDNCRGFCVYDTATSSSRSHADICQAVSGSATSKRTTAFDRRLRKKLMKVFSNKPTDLSAVYKTVSN